MTPTLRSIRGSMFRTVPQTQRRAKRQREHRMLNATCKTSCLLLAAVRAPRGEINMGEEYPCIINLRVMCGCQAPQSIRTTENDRTD